MLIDAPTAAQIRDTATDVFRRPEFQRHRSLLERFLEWLARILRGRDAPTPEVQVGSGGSALGELLLYLLFAVLVAFVVWLVVRIARTYRRKPKERGEVDEPARIEEERPAAEWRSDAERAEAEGRWKDAMRDRYRELVSDLVERRILPDVPGRTTGELRVDMEQHAAAGAELFNEACLLFELPWYADVATGPEENARIRHIAAELRELETVDSAHSKRRRFEEAPA